MPILVIAVTVAFLVVTTLLILAGGAQTAALAAESDAVAGPFCIGVREGLTR